MYRTNYVEIDESAITHNTRALLGALTPGTGLMAVVKANGYGHGGPLAARAALRGGASMLAVAIPEEGEALRQADIDAPVLALGTVEPSAAEAVVRLGLTQTVCDWAGVEALEKAARTMRKRVSVHLKLDTGMARLGVRDTLEAVALARAIAQSEWLRYDGVFTHFACADDPNDEYTRMQQACFSDMLSTIEGAVGLPPLRHAANSAAALRFPQTHFDLARVGIALYGAPPVACDVPLLPAMRWVTRAAMVKDLPRGACVSYGATFTAQRDTRLMVLPVGYADGYRRALSNRAQVLVRGRRAPIVGIVCMDMCMADVTDVPGCGLGDEVVLLGQQGDDCICADELAGWMGSIAYEALLAPSARVPRVSR